MSNFFQIIGAALVGALVTFAVMKLIQPKPTVITTESQVKTIVVEQDCPKMVIDSIAIYETIRKGKLRKTKPGKVTEEVIEPVTEEKPEIVMTSYVYEDSLLYVGEAILHEKGCILDFSRSIRLDTLTLERTFTKTITEIEYVPQEVSVPKIKYKSTFNILAGGGADVWPQFRLSGIAGFKTKKDQVFLYEYTPAIGNIDPNQRAIHSIKALVPLKFKRNHE